MFVEFHRCGLGLAWIETELGVSLELEGWSDGGGDQVLDIDLNDLFAGQFTGVLYVDLDFKVARGGDGRDGEIAVFERGV